MVYFHTPTKKGIHDIALSKMTRQSKLVEWFMKCDAIHDEIYMCAQVCIITMPMYVCVCVQAHSHRFIYQTHTDNVCFWGAVGESGDMKKYIYL